ncbi:MAG: hypothetical protein ACAF41_01015 (plasmid) [Leptolyngbya sp. BL-A-14]
MSNSHWSVPDVSKVNSDSFNGCRLKLELRVAKEFFQGRFSTTTDLASHEIDQQLWRIHSEAIATGDSTTQFGAELCLRCRISNLISDYCLKLARDFYTYRITWYDLFTCFPYEDGRPIDWQKPDAYSLFTVELLQAYNPSRNGKASLKTLVERKVSQSKSLAQFLLQHRILLRSDWALLNRAPLSELPPFDAAIVKAFHDVYRRDRRLDPTSKTDGKCPDPTPQQLLEMLHLLRSRNVEMGSEATLHGHLIRIAGVLREREILRQGGLPRAESLELSDTGTDGSRDVPDIFITSDPVDALAEEDFQAICDQLQAQEWEMQAQLDASLCWGVENGIGDRINFLRSKPKRAHLAELFEKALYLLYCEGLSQTEIGKRLDMRQDEVCVLVNRRDLYKRIGDRTLEALLKRIVQITQALRITKDPPERAYLDALTTTLTAFLESTLNESTLAGYIQQFLKSRRSETP